MKNILKSAFIVFICLLMLSCTAFASNNILPLSSEYIFGKHANMKAGSNGELIISFWVSSPAIMTTLGASSIDIYNGSGPSAIWIDTIYASDPDCEKMLGSGTYHSCDIIYQGTVGREYYAKIHFVASDNTGGDSITKATPSVIAKKQKSIVLPPP